MRQIWTISDSHAIQRMKEKDRRAKMTVESDLRRACSQIAFEGTFETNMVLVQIKFYTNSSLAAVGKTGAEHIWTTVIGGT